MTLLTLGTLALAAPQPRLSGPLAEAAALTDGAARLDWERRWGEPYPDPDRVTAVVELTEGADAAGLVALAGALGAIEPVVSPGLVQLRVPFERLAALAALDGARRVRQPRVARPRDAVISEGLDALGAGDWQAQGLTGAGVRVAVLDVGFEGYPALLGTELPASIGDRLSADWEGSSHGTAVAEVVHDIAPSAALYFYDFRTDVEFIDRLNDILADEIDVVNASVGFDNVWPPDGSSPWSQAVDQLAGYGVVYVAAAGNEAENYAGGALSDSDGDGWVELAGAESVQVKTRDGQASVSLRWSDPPDASGHDLDLYILDGDGAECGRSQEPQAGEGFPYELVICDTRSAWVEAWIYNASGGDVSGLDAWIYTAAGVHSDAATPASSLTLPADAQGAIAVGAYVPETGELASYSSQGPTLDGRIKPDFVAPAGVSTVTYGPGAFDGTSASAPHAAGLIALLLEDKPRADPDQVRALLVEGALDLGDPGPDNAFGEGALQSFELGCGGGGCAIVRTGGGRSGGRRSGSGALAALAGLAALVARRWR